MKRFVIFLVLLIVIPLAIFAGDIKATGFGTTKEAAEKNAYIELSKYINISVYNEERLSEYSDNISESISKYSSNSVQTSSNNFFNTTKTFVEVEGGYNCVVVLYESTFESYIALIEDYVKSINNLEEQYEKNKDNSSIEINKITIKNILGLYSEYNRAKAVLLALNKYSSNIIKPNNTSDIWNNEYQNIIIKYNNELANKKELLNSIDNSKEIDSQIDAINIEIAKASIELDNFEKQKSKALNQSILQNQKEMDNEITNILNKLQVENISSYYSNQSDIKLMLNDFRSYYNQYNDINNEYNNLIEAQKSQINIETLDGVNAIKNRDYLFSELDRYSRASIVAQKIRNNEVESFIAKKEKELENNLKIIDDRFIPMQNKLQSKMLELLANIENHNEFIINVNPQSVITELNTRNNSFICTLSISDSYPFVDKFKVEIPLGSIDEKMIFNINDSNFNVKDESQILAYNSYNQSVSDYKDIIENNSFLTFQLKIRLKFETVKNRFNSGNINTTITSEIVDVQVIRNDTKTKLNGINIASLTSDKIIDRYDNFIDTKIKLIETYYSPLALSFYNKINKSTYYISNVSNDSKVSIPQENISPNYSIPTTTNALGDPYLVPNKVYSSNDKFFFSFGVGFIPVNGNFKSFIKSKYHNLLTETTSYKVVEAPFITQVYLNFDYYNPARTSLFFEGSLGLRTFDLIKYDFIKYTRKNYTQFGANIKMGVSLLLNTSYTTYILFIPFAEGGITKDGVNTAFGAKLLYNSNKIGTGAIGYKYYYSGLLENKSSIFFEFGI